jgi:hypothetical protein
MGPALGPIQAAIAACGRSLFAGTVSRVPQAVAAPSKLCCICIEVMHRGGYAARMPTLNPRITITLTPAVAAVLKRMSELTGNSQSAMVGELLADNLPIFERMVQVLQAAKAIKGRARQDIVESMAATQQRLEQQLGLLLDLADQEAPPLLDQAEQVTRRGAGGGKRSAPPATRSVATPASNRGVRLTRNKPRKANREGVL